MTENQGNLYIISSVAGGGKSTLIDLLLRKHPEILFSVSYTSRPIRGGEKNGLNYHFVSKEELERMINSMSIIKIARLYGVSDSSIRKRCKKFSINIPKFKRGFWNKKHYGGNGVEEA